MEEPKARQWRRLHSANPLRAAKDEPYYAFTREEVIETILSQGLAADRILEIGCSSGGTGARLKEALKASRYVGIEKFEPAARAAEKILDQVHIADVETTDLMEFGLKENEFDLLVALDVLEHLYNPWDVLAELTTLVRPGGHVVLSIPNIQNVTILLGLVETQWTYETAGLLDATHLRFFTLTEMESLVAGAGLVLLDAKATLNPPLDLERVMETGNSFEHGRLRLVDLTRDEVLRLFTYQYIITARKP